MPNASVRKVLVRYRVKADRVAENEAAIRAVFDELATRKPPGLHYQSLKLGDGVTFVHIISAPAATHELFGELASFKAFTSGVRARCDELPVALPWEAIGDFRSPGRQAD